MVADTLFPTSGQIHFSDLCTDESALTGESRDIRKTHEDPFLLSGTSIKLGQCTYVVTGVGLFSEEGIINKIITGVGKEEVSVQCGCMWALCFYRNIGLGIRPFDSTCSPFFLSFFLFLSLLCMDMHSHLFLYLCFSLQTKQLEEREAEMFHTEVKSALDAEYVMFAVVKQHGCLCDVSSITGAAGVVFTFVRSLVLLFFCVYFSINDLYYVDLVG